jgi:hypothetical protein
VPVAGVAAPTRAISPATSIELTRAADDLAVIPTPIRRFVLDTGIGPRRAYRGASCGLSESPADTARP